LAPQSSVNMQSLCSVRLNSSSDVEEDEEEVEEVEDEEDVEVEDGVRVEEGQRAVLVQCQTRL